MHPPLPSRQTGVRVCQSADSVHHEWSGSSWLVMSPRDTRATRCQPSPRPEQSGRGDVIRRHRRHRHVGGSSPLVGSTLSIIAGFFQLRRILRRRPCQCGIRVSLAGEQGWASKILMSAIPLGMIGLAQVGVEHFLAGGLLAIRAGLCGDEYGTELIHKLRVVHG